MPRVRKVCLYGNDGTPTPAFNATVRKWLEGELPVVEHQKPAAFSGIHGSYIKTLEAHIGEGASVRDAHKLVLSNLTKLMFGYDLSMDLKDRLVSSLINATGFRTTLSQGVAKNVGENFVNVLVFALAALLEDRDDVLVDKGLPPALKSSLTLTRIVPLAGGDKEIRIPLEGDLAIFSRANPLRAIVVSAKTRLKEVFHVGTMWKLFFDMIGDKHCLDKWALKAADNATRADLTYVFATADMVNAEGKKTQGPDVERDEPRNLIAMDASFFDYVFVSKSGIKHVARTLELDGKKEALFHELGCLVDLIEQKFGIEMPTPSETSSTTGRAPVAAVPA